MEFSAFIESHIDAIVAEWERFARTILPPADGMSTLALRDHCKAILVAVSKDMATSQTGAARAAKSKGVAQVGSYVETAAAAHGAFRHVSGFTLGQVFAEFRALRASVLELWRCHGLPTEALSAVEEIARFNEAIDQAIAESIQRYERHAAEHWQQYGELGQISEKGYLTAVGDPPGKPPTRQR